MYPDYAVYNVLFIVLVDYIYCLNYSVNLNSTFCDVKHR